MLAVGSSFQQLGLGLMPILGTFLQLLLIWLFPRKVIGRNLLRCVTKEVHFQNRDFFLVALIWGQRQLDAFFVLLLAIVLCNNSHLCV